MTKLACLDLFNLYVQIYQYCIKFESIRCRYAQDDKFNILYHQCSSLSGLGMFQNDQVEKLNDIDPMYLHNISGSVLDVII